MNTPHKPTPNQEPPFLREATPYLLAACKWLAQRWDEEEDEWEEVIQDASEAVLFAEGRLNKPFPSPRSPKKIILNKKRWGHLCSCVPDDSPSMEAAAPHLLAACRRLLQQWDEEDGFSGGVVEDAQIAIIKAEGWHEPSSPSTFDTHPLLEPMLKSFPTLLDLVDEHHRLLQEFDTGDRILRAISKPQYDRASTLLAEIETAAIKLYDEPLDLDAVTLKAVARVVEYSGFVYAKLNAQPLSNDAPE